MHMAAIIIMVLYVLNRPLALVPNQCLMALFVVIVVTVKFAFYHAECKKFLVT